MRDESGIGAPSCRQQIYNSTTEKLQVITVWAPQPEKKELRFWRVTSELWAATAGLELLTLGTAIWLAIIQGEMSEDQQFWHGGWIF